MATCRWMPGEKEPRAGRRTAHARGGPAGPRTADATAMECIRMAKEEHVPPITFLPVSSFRADTPDDRLRTLGGTARMAIDCLAVRDDAVTRIFQGIVG